MLPESQFVSIIAREVSLSLSARSRDRDSSNRRNNLWRNGLTCQKSVV